MSTITREDFDLFLEKNRELVQRCERVYKKLLDIRKEKEALSDRLGTSEEEKKRLAEELTSLQQTTDRDLYQGGKTLAQLRNYIADLVAQTREELSDYE